mmetsp:Transcript_40979/g.92229  ORF Transcript_40979/g.92229 Transcript_40979/m.92229 type:complete len:327 (-) Transcript_40979:1772-2752(-)
MQSHFPSIVGRCHDLGSEADLPCPGRRNRKPPRSPRVICAMGLKTGLGATSAAAATKASRGAPPLGGSERAFPASPQPGPKSRALRLSSPPLSALPPPPSSPTSSLFFFSSCQKSGAGSSPWPNIMKRSMAVCFQRAKATGSTSPRQWSRIWSLVTTASGAIAASGEAEASEVKATEVKTAEGEEELGDTPAKAGPGGAAAGAAPKAPSAFPRGGGDRSKTVAKIQNQSSFAPHGVTNSRPSAIQLSMSARSSSVTTSLRSFPLGDSGRFTGAFFFLTKRTWFGTRFREYLAGSSTSGSSPRALRADTTKPTCWKLNFPPSKFWRQ